MQLWSIEQSSFIDFIDGYTFLGFLSRENIIKRESLSSEHFSTMCHEFIHQTALDGPFGWLTSYFVSLRSAVDMLAELEEDATSRPLGDVGRSWQERIRQYLDNTPDISNQERTLHEQVLRFDDESRQRFIAFIATTRYSDALLDYQALLHSYRWVLEGIALFVQLDFRPSNDFEVASDIFNFAVQWLTATNQIRGINEAHNYFVDTQNIVRQAGLLRFLINNSDPSRSPYFFGYMIIKEIQRVLSQKDSRLKDPEVFLIIINAYFFRDIQLLELCEVLPQHLYQEKVNIFLRNTCETLVKCTPASLIKVVDAVCNYETASVNFAYLDVASSIRANHLTTWATQELYEQFQDQIERFYDVRLADPVFTRVYDMQSSHSVEVRNRMISHTIQLFGILSRVMRFFKFNHARRAIISYYRQEESVRINSVVSLGYNQEWSTMELARYIPYRYFQDLENQFNSENLRINDPELSRLFIEAKDSSENWSRLVDLLNDNAQNLAIIQDFDIYFAGTLTRLNLWIRDNFMYIIPNGLDQIPVPLLQLLSELGDSFHHETYAPLLKPRLSESFNRNSPPDLIDEYFALWQIVFGQVNATQQEFNAFIDQKAKLIFKSKEETDLLTELSTQLNSKMASEQHVAVNNINRRWHHFTNRDLIIDNGNSVGNLNI